MTIDPLLSLALNVHSSKGVYALMIGSGVSRSAKIPTGWEVVLDLIRRLAKLKAEDCEPDPAAWFKTSFGEDPDYSKLLDQLATSPEQRQQMLRGYFEPTEEERVDGLKQPTVAHRAIGRLVAGGYVRVILTTNFDKLLEQAIQDVGVTPTVISTPDGFVGAVPLAHQRCVVVKLHGDYLDTRVKNTPAELDAYEKAIDSWLDRIFDEFGLIVAGWSGEWDTALRRALERCTTRRFGFWWASVSEPKAAAISLTGTRGGSIIRVAGADQFFEDLADKVEVLDEVYPDHPLNLATAVAMAKRFLGEPRQVIRLDDLIMKETDRAFAAVSKQHAEILASNAKIADYTSIVNYYLGQTATLRALVAVAAYWGGRSTLDTIVRSIIRMGHDPQAIGRRSGTTLNDAFRILPALPLLYVAGLAYAAKGEIDTTALLFQRVKNYESEREVKTLVDRFTNALGSINSIFKTMKGHERQFVPFSELMFLRLPSELVEMFPDPASFDVGLDEFEFLMAMLYVDAREKDVIDDQRVHITPGRFCWKSEGYMLASPLFIRDGEGDAVELCRQQEPFQRLIAAGYFQGDWGRLVKVRRAVVFNAPRWARGY